MYDFKLGDHVYASDWCYGQVVDIDGDFVMVEFDTGSGGGMCTFEAHEVRLAEDKNADDYLYEKITRNYMYDKLKDHVGHHIVCVAYGDIDDPVDICIECEDCCCVLVSAEDFQED
jgi:hypothetical protein